MADLTLVGETLNHPANEPFDPNVKKIIKLTSEELRTLKECRRESFFYRCVPFSAVAMTATHWAVKTGYLAPNVKWGSSVKVFGAGVLGYFLGKFSYQKRCAEKLMGLPNSKLGEALKNRYHIGDRREIEIEPDYVQSLPYDKRQPEPVTVDELDTHKNIQHEGLDDSSRPTVDSTPSFPAEPELPSREYVSYDELRKQNRQEYESKKLEVIRKSGALPSIYRRPTEESTMQNKPDLEKARNKYGDVWEE